MAAEEAARIAEEEEAARIAAEEAEAEAERLRLEEEARIAAEEAAAEEEKKSAAESTEKPKSDKISVVFCIDISGSMQSCNRLELCKKAIIAQIN